MASVFERVALFLVLIFAVNLPARFVVTDDGITRDYGSITNYSRMQTEVIQTQQAQIRDYQIITNSFARQADYWQEEAAAQKKKAKAAELKGIAESLIVVATFVLGMLAGKNWK